MIDILRNKDRSLFEESIGIRLNWKTALLLLVIVLAVFTRLYDLGARVMSHDEINHVYFAYQYYKGVEYLHDPLSHGPLQFHLLYLAYFIFGASDFSARLPSAILGIASVLFVLKYRRIIGDTGTWAAAILMIISPLVLFYDRYARNEAYVVLWGLITLWAIFAYLEKGDKKYFYYLTAANALHFTTKETSFIYLAQALLFLGFLFIFRVYRCGE